MSATAGNASVDLSWTAAVGALGYSVSSYSIGQSTVSSGPYAFTSVGNVLSSSVSSLTVGTPYYFIIRAHDPNSFVIATSSEVSATPTAAASTPPSSPPSGGGGGGGGGGIIPVSNTGVSFSGRAYPGSTVTILKDAAIAATTIAGSDAAFQITVNNLTAGNVIFSVYSEDNNGKSLLTAIFPSELNRRGHNQCDRHLYCADYFCG